MKRYQFSLSNQSAVDISCQQHLNSSTTEWRHEMIRRFCVIGYLASNPLDIDAIITRYPLTYQEEVENYKLRIKPVFIDGEPLTELLNVMLKYDFVKRSLLIRGLVLLGYQISQGQIPFSSKMIEKPFQPIQPIQDQTIQSVTPRQSNQASQMPTEGKSSGPAKTKGKKSKLNLGSLMGKSHND